MDEEAAVELTVGVASDLHHLALSSRGVSVGGAGWVHGAALQQY